MRSVYSSDADRVMIASVAWTKDDNLIEECRNSHAIAHAKQHCSGSIGRGINRRRWPAGLLRGVTAALHNFS